MFFKQLEIGSMQNFAYLIADEKTKEAAVVDPGFDSDKILDELNKNNFKLTHILCTHAHFDHVGAVDELVNKTNATIFVHKLEPTNFNNNQNIKTIKKDDIIKVGNINVNVLHTPGHTQGSVIFQIDNKLLTGDTLFVGGCGRTDLAGGNTKTLFESLQKLKSLPDNLEIYPGHDYGTKPVSTIKYEKQNNRFLICSTLKDFKVKRDD
jgi:hydroxyacylglutathione hydrolase